MEYGPQILSQLNTLQRDVGGLTSDVAGLRRDFDRARDESSDRLKAVQDSFEGKLDDLNEASERRHVEIGKLRALVERCPEHESESLVQVRRRPKAEDSGELKAARRGVLKSLALLLGAAATAVSGWWATHSK